MGANILDDKQAWQAIYGGFLNFDYPLPFTCPGGKCTWPAFHTFGVCSQCQDVSSEATRQCVGTETSDDSENECSEVAYDSKSTNLTLSLKNGTVTDKSTIDSAKTYTVTQSVVTSPFPNGLYNSTLFDFLIAQLDIDFEQANSSTTNPTWNFTQCSIRWCSRIYEGVSISDGALLAPAPKKAEVYITSSRACNSSLCQDVSTNASAMMPNGENADYKLILNTAVAGIPKLMSFGYDVEAYGNGTWGSSSVFSVTSTMFLNVDISSAIAKVVQAYTDRLRAYQSASVQGTVLVTTTIIQIRWEWLVLPALVVAGSAVFLIGVLLVIALRPQYGKVLWKGSSLPLLYCPLDSEPSRWPKTRSAMSDEMRGVRARLKENGDGSIGFVTDRSI